MIPLVLLTVGFGLAAADSSAQKKTLAVVVPGLDNPFFSEVGLGCEKWNSDHQDSEYECFFTGPPLSSDVAGQVQILADLFAKNVAGIAIWPSDASAVAATIRNLSANLQMPIVTIGTDFAPDDQGFRASFLGTDQFRMGAEMAERLKALRADGGTVCLQLSDPAAGFVNERVTGFRTTIAGEADVDRLRGQGGWTEPDHCPLVSNRDIAAANQQLLDAALSDPGLDAFILIDGWAQFEPNMYAATCAQLKPRFASTELVVIAGDTLPQQMQALKSGCSLAQIGQRPIEMGYSAPDILIKALVGESVEDKIFTGLDLCTPENAGTCLAATIPRCPPFCSP